MRKILTCILQAITIVSCSVTRYIPNDDQLYIGTKKVEFADADKYALDGTGIAAMEEVKSLVSYPPNGAFADNSALRGIPFGLLWYNTFRNSTTRIGKWFFNAFAAPPVLISDVKPTLRAEAASEVLKYYGYFNGYVKADTMTLKRNDKKARVEYKVTLNKPCFIGDVAYRNFPDVADSLIAVTYNERVVRGGEQFDATKMVNERMRLSALFRNNGYCYFQPQYITFLADTVLQEGKADIHICPADNIPQRVLQQWRFGKSNIRIFDSVDSDRNDTITGNGLTYIFNGKREPVRIGVLQRNIEVQEGSLYSYDKQKSVLERLSRTNIFSDISLDLQPRGNSDTLDMNIAAYLDKPYDFSFELNTTAKSNGQVGPGSKIAVTKKNLFRSGETLGISLKGSYEWQTDKKIKGKAAVINSWEVGADVSLFFPRLYIPMMKHKGENVPSFTSLRLYGDLMNRSGFFRMIRLGGDVTYRIFANRTTTHTVTPFRLTYDMLSSTTARFDSIVATNQSIKNSFRNQFIPAIQYTYLYDNTETECRNKSRVKLAVTSAGNLTSLVFMAFGENFNEKEKGVWGNPYAQFVKGTAELCQLWKIDNSQYIATRIMTGALFCYGNSRYAPYSEQFYIGGASSLRAFTIRSVGPGGYHPKSDSRYAYLDETGTFKLEMNVEYRFRIIGKVHGALFVDAGNIWLIKKNPERPGGELRARSFGKQIALNTGVGIRYNLDFLVLRVDFGLGIHAPYHTGRKGYFNLAPFKDGFAWHFAIGYPF